MDRPATANPATAREIILEIVRNMREGLEPLHYSTLPPSIFHVYLHPDDMERLRGIAAADRGRGAPRARCRGGDAEPRSLGERLKIAKRPSRRLSPPDGGWQIRILENTDDDVEPGDIVIHSELALPAKAEFGAGSMTKRIATRRMGGARDQLAKYEPRPSRGAGREPRPQRSRSLRGHRIRRQQRAARLSR